MDPVTASLLGTVGASLITGYMGSQAAEQAGQAQLAGIKAGIKEKRQGFRDIQPYWDPYEQAGRGALKDLLTMQESGEFDIPVLDEYQFEGDAMDYLDPSIAFQQEQAKDVLESSAAGMSGLYSGATLAELQDRSQNIGMMGYGDAYSRMTADRAFDYADYMNRFNSEIASIQNKRANLSDLINTGMSAASNLTAGRTGVASDVAGMRTQQGQVQGQMAAAPWVAASGAIRDIGQAGMQYAGYQMARQPQGQIAPQISAVPTQGNVAPTMQGYAPSTYQVHVPTGGGAPSYNRSYGIR